MSVVVVFVCLVFPLVVVLSVGFFPSFLLPEGTFASNMLEVSHCFFTDSTMGDPRRFTS